MRCKPRLDAELADARRSAPPGADADSLQPKTPFLEKPLGNVHADYTARSDSEKAAIHLEGSSAGQIIITDLLDRNLIKPGRY